MRPRDFRSDVQTEAEALARRTTVSAKEGLKKLPHDNRVDGVAFVRYDQL